MTIDQLALATQKEFQIIHDEFRATRGEMATKAALAELCKSFDENFKEVNTSISDLRTIVEALAAQVSAYMARTNEDISKLQAADKNLGIRLRVLEKRG